MEKKTALNWKRLARKLAGVCVLALVALVLRAQEDSFPGAVVREMAQIPEPDGPPVTVHGLVVNAATGEGLARALVNVGGKRGALTDGAGRFSIPGVASGVQGFEVSKPGFNPPEMAGESFGETMHLVRVSRDMADLTLKLTPENSIGGRVTLSTGVPGEGIRVELLQRFVVEGRASWEIRAGEQLTAPSGRFRFSGLADGAYLVKTVPDFENLRAQEPECNAKAPADMPGYAGVFYGGSHEAAGAARIEVKGGEQAQADLSLSLIQFHLVQIAMGNLPGTGRWSFEHVLRDGAGQRVDSPTREEKDHTVCAYLPDGTYSLMAYATRDDDVPIVRPNRPMPGGQAAGDMAGTLNFGVEGHAQRGLRLTLGPAAESPVYLHYEPHPLKSGTSRPGYVVDGFGGEREPLIISAVPANGYLSQASRQAEGSPVDESHYSLPAAPPGSYWIHATTDTGGTCMGEVTAAGQNLAVSPWVVGDSGAGAPIDVVLRTDCAQLTLEMGPNLPTGQTGESARFYVYAVPEFPSMEGVFTAVLDQIAEHSQKLAGMSPGTYQVFAFHTPRAIEFRSPEAIRALGAGKVVTLEPGADAKLVIEEAEP